MSHVEVRPLDETVLVQAMRKVLSGDSDRLGCAVSFTGIVKGTVGDKRVEQLHLGLTEDLESRLRTIAEEAAEKWPSTRVLIYHNRDDLRPGEFVTHIVVSAQNRAEAFDAAREIIERIKAEVHVDLVETYAHSG